MSSPSWKLADPKAAVTVDDFIKNLLGNIGINTLSILIFLQQGQVCRVQATGMTQLIMSVWALIFLGKTIVSGAGLDAECCAAVEDDARVDWLEHV